MAHGPQQRLYGFRATYDVPIAEFRATMAQHGGNIDAACAHHRQDELVAMHRVRCVHCHRMRYLRSRAALEGHRPPVVWCWACGDWRCNAEACAGCERGSKNRLRALDAIDEARASGKRVHARLFLACAEVGLPARGMAVEQRGVLAVASRPPPRPVALAVVGA